MPFFATPLSPWTWSGSFFFSFIRLNPYTAKKTHSSIFKNIVLSARIILLLLLFIIYFKAKIKRMKSINMRLLLVIVKKEH